MRNNGSVSMADVARLARVSAQTVSRVANGSAEVRPETRRKVEQAMKELGYRPNYAARALKRGRFRDVGVVMFDIARYGNARILNGVVEAASDRGYAVTLRTFGVEGPSSMQSALDEMRQLPVDGVIVVMERMLPDLGSYVPIPDLPVVLVTEDPADGFPVVNADQYNASVAMVDYLCDLGHETVYHIAGPALSIAARVRMRGWQDALRKRGITPPPLYTGDWSADSGYQAGLALAHERGCTAVYAANDQMAYGAMLGLRHTGKSVPDDVSVVGVDDSLKGIVPRLELTTMRLDFEEIGRRAFDVVFDRCQKGEPKEVEKITVPPVMVERSSVRSLHEGGTEMA